MQQYHGFPPLFDGNSKILILGSFPSVKSRAEGFYYGNKQNRFWSTLCSALGAPLAETVEAKKELCLSCGIALWDVVDSCEIRGSMDADIENYRLVDLNEVLERAKIVKILCNGATAYRLTTSIYDGNIPVYKMPSTSPANVRFDKDAWLTQLKGE
ncbi:MAG: DNA-deoxyinosine glycosylase [Corallococcus sp.]|nr:DNA-deoxyinosine glycosylase [Corallococcus sp.]